MSDAFDMPQELKELRKQLLKERKALNELLKKENQFLLEKHIERRNEGLKPSDKLYRFLLRDVGLDNFSNFLACLRMREAIGMHLNGDSLVDIATKIGIDERVVSRMVSEYKTGFYDGFRTRFSFDLVPSKP
jgi:hypothetical protein